MTKNDRAKIFNKYDGRCAYCGCELQKGWHVDELLPCRRIYTEEYDPEKRKWIRKFIRYQYPERVHIDNQMPACPSCNINKHSESIEDFRNAIKAYMNHLNDISTQYKIAKRFGLITETNIEVKFYFETYANILHQ